MEWILYIVGGLFLIGLLSAIGFFTELFTMIFTLRRCYFW